MFLRPRRVRVVQCRFALGTASGPRYRSGMDSQDPQSGEALPPKTIWLTLAIATAIPFIALFVLAALMVATNFNIMNWME